MNKNGKINKKSEEKRLKEQKFEYENSWIKKYATSDEITRVYSTDSINTIAYKIFGGFGIGQSCAVVGVVQTNPCNEVQKKECEIALSKDEVYTTVIDGRFIVNCIDVEPKFNMVWSKLQELCSRRGNTKKFKCNCLGGIDNIYRIK